MFIKARIEEVVEINLGAMRLIFILTADDMRPCGADATFAPYTNLTARCIYIAKGGDYIMTEKEEKRLQILREKMSQIKAQENTILAKDRAKQRKEKTRRLIKNGELAERLLNCEGMNPNEFEKVLRYLIENANVKNS